MIVEKSATLINKYGLHARPATLFVEACNRYACDILVIKDDKEVNGKSIMGIMMLGAETGTTLTFRASGQDAEEATSTLVALVESSFGEQD